MVEKPEDSKEGLRGIKTPLVRIDRVPASASPWILHGKPPMRYPLACTND